MAASGETSHYKLAKYNPNDITTWDDFNGNMDKIDETMGDLDSRIEEIVNSPDVRYIKETYAELEAIVKSTIGDQDYARVLKDETHGGESTFYQFSKADQDWKYVGGADSVTPAQLKAVEDKIPTEFLTINGKSVNSEGTLNLQTPLISGVNCKTLNNESLLTGGNINISPSIIKSNVAFTGDKALSWSGAESSNTIKNGLTVYANRTHVLIINPQIYSFVSTPSAARPSAINLRLEYKVGATSTFVPIGIMQLCVAQSSFGEKTTNYVPANSMFVFSVGGEWSGTDTYFSATLTGVDGIGDRIDTSTALSGRLLTF